MFTNTLTALLAFAGAVTAYPSAKRATDNEVRIYAYGTGISGMQIYRGTDGMAYIAPAETANLTELIWQTPSVSSEWNATTMENGTSTTDSSAAFYIVTASNSYVPCGFKSSNTTAPTGATMTGFTTFGSQIVWVNGSNYQSQFWAKTTDTDNVYTLNWNVDGANQADSVPVTVKTVAPSSA
ncbi:hypothetical protein M406DRAFT_333989 [Cryphonectria parasitica EP155]|uniref:Uncharacterized protein n=1 Tax=Cryphonectria parasitica (strain ATCC 38755 / EP155) TaxID=660469 RepID=A0A9P5CKD7_CRYP1|nr:uncharacterized protein M406DRAFT_333989 [Cryphonectria parasitica EP155]KAF3761943.1 hypothetical protein M406DRAFT_333989 [Cryphonectria parasitica EP155]